VRVVRTVEDSKDRLVNKRIHDPRVVKLRIPY
jgi:hypothetical protein